MLISVNNLGTQSRVRVYIIYASTHTESCCNNYRMVKHHYSIHMIIAKTIDSITRHKIVDATPSTIYGKNIVSIEDLQFIAGGELFVDIR